ncbi:hypothetical protein [Aquimarina sp. RZ0]|uniref:hypothetical protein n=1 Tax=Aquimarina sp. RZ0 TaxID=2607730 RepID=UPI0011F29229|nr:hypothetical protein [Aquimarina sp. RZ0]KAA1242654.1 hypothetical protein F0000_24690 [Aquimarina sp. RZ0]
METNNLHNNKSGFKTPEDYFENFDKKLSKKLNDSATSIFPNAQKNSLDISENNVFRNLTKNKEKPSITLNNLTSGMLLPENYFEEVEKRILQNTIQSKTTSKTISLFSKKNILYVSGIAAMIAIILSITIYKNKDSLININSLELSDIQEYFEGEDVYIDENIALLFEEKINLFDTFDTSEVSNETLLDYLSDEEFESETID